MNGKKSAFEIISFAGTVAALIIAFFPLLEVPVLAQQQQQQQTMSPTTHHPDNGNQSSSSNNSTEQQHQQNATTMSEEMMSSRMMNQTFNKSWISFVSGIKVTEVSIIDNQHIAVNLRYDGEGAPPGASVVALAMTSNSSTAALLGEKGEMMSMILPNNQRSNSSASPDKELKLQQQQQQQQISSSNSVINSIMQILSVQSGSNYLEAGWQGQGSNSTTVLVALDGDTAKAENVMVGVIPFLHH